MVLKSWLCDCHAMLKHGQRTDFFSKKIQHCIDIWQNVWIRAWFVAKEWVESLDISSARCFSTWMSYSWCFFILLVNALFDEVRVPVTGGQRHEGHHLRFLNKDKLIPSNASEFNFFKCLLLTHAVKSTPIDLLVWTLLHLHLVFTPQCWKEIQPVQCLYMFIIGGTLTILCALLYERVRHFAWYLA